jgi:hypothetical protein
MSDMSDENSTIRRGDVMRHIAALHAELYCVQFAKVSAGERDLKTQELRKRLAALAEQIWG